VPGFWHTLRYSIDRWCKWVGVVYKSLVDDPAARSFSPSALREAMARRLYRRSVAMGQIAVPAVPSLIDEYVRMCDNLFASVGVQYSPEEFAQLKTALKTQLAAAFRASSRSPTQPSYAFAIVATSVLTR
jgi:hypothetical protein